MFLWCCKRTRGRSTGAGRSWGRHLHGRECQEAAGPGRGDLMRHQGLRHPWLHWEDVGHSQEPGQSRADGRRGEHAPSPEEEQRNLSEWLFCNIIFLPAHERGVGLFLAARVWHWHLQDLHLAAFNSLLSVCIWVQHSGIQLGFFRWFEMMLSNARTPQWCSTHQCWESPSYQHWSWKSFLRLHWAVMGSGCRRSHEICRHWQDSGLHGERCRVYNWCKQHQIGMDFWCTWLFHLLTDWVTHGHWKKLEIN